jgi:hypothetical protein
MVQEKVRNSPLYCKTFKQEGLICQGVSMGSYARLLSYLPKVTVLVAVVENTALLKGMKATR